MKVSVKSKVAKATNDNINLNRQVLSLKKSFDELNKLLNSSDLPKRKK